MGQVAKSATLATNERLVDAAQSCSRWGGAKVRMVHYHPGHSFWIKNQKFNYSACLLKDIILKPLMCLIDSVQNNLISCPNPEESAPYNCAT